jgi:preprotein translocase SecE subunit
MQSSQKIVNLGIILAGVAVFLFLSNMIQALWSLARLPRMHEWIVYPTDLISFVLTTGACFYTRRHEKANRFLNEVAIELSKVTWPDNKETVISTGISCVMVVICALILLGFDSLWGTIMRGLFAI